MLVENYAFNHFFNKTSNTSYFAPLSDWEQRKLETIADYGKGKLYSKNDLTNEGNQIILYGQLYTDYSVEIKATNTLVKPKTNSIYSTGNEVIVPASGESAEDISIASAIKSSNIIIGSDLNIIYPKQFIHNTFLALTLSSGETKKRLSKFAQGKTIVHLHVNNFKKLPISYPTLNEQLKISKFISGIESLVTLHQRKINTIKKLKQQYLNLLFPENYSNVPQLRFKQFERAWEKCKIKDLFLVTRGKVLASNEMVDEPDESNPYPVYSSQTKNNGLMGFYSKYLFEDAITWTTDGANAGTVNYRPGKFYSTNVNGVLLSNKIYTNQFIAENLNMIAWKHVSRVGNPKLMNNVMAEIQILIPKYKEQQELSRFLNGINRIIEGHQSKLHMLRRLKTSYLDKMFL